MGLTATQSSGSSTPCASSPKQKPEAHVSLELPSHLDFFRNVDCTGYPTSIPQATQRQPWKDLWEGPQLPAEGRLLVAVPRCSDYGALQMILAPSSCFQASVSQG